MARTADQDMTSYHRTENAPWNHPPDNENRDSKDRAGQSETNSNDSNTTSIPNLEAHMTDAETKTIEETTDPTAEPAVEPVSGPVSSDTQASTDEVATDEASAASDDAPEVEYQLSEPLPDLLTKLSRPGIIARLERASKRGRLPGFSSTSVEGICSVAAHGDPFDRKLIALSDQEPDGRTRLRWRTRLTAKMPIVLAVLLAVSVWPGEPLTDSALKHWIPIYNSWTNPEAGGQLKTWYWYLPVMLPSAFWTWRSAMKRSARTTHQSAHEAVRKIAAEVKGELVTPKFGSKRTPQS